MDIKKTPYKRLYKDVYKVQSNKSNGDEGNRTPVQISRHNRVYANSLAI